LISVAGLIAHSSASREAEHKNGCAAWFVIGPTHTNRFDWSAFMLRILSDLHFRDATTRLRRLEDLAPVLEDVDELWLNGDTCDNQTGMTMKQLDDIRDFFRQRVPRVRFITGNHDPNISDDHEALTADGLLWATHGDVFMDEIVPWSRVVEKLRARVAAARTARDDLNYSVLPDRYLIQRAACRGFGRECDPERAHWSHRLKRIAIEMFPPRQPYAMVKSWLTMASRVADGAERWHPAARVVVTGHVHWPFVARRGERTIINTGAFSSPVGAYAVSWDGAKITVSRLEQRRALWHCGRTVAEIPLATPAASAVSKSA
jgi:predicted phosphodiesterase